MKAVLAAVLIGYGISMILGRKEKEQPVWKRGSFWLWKKMKKRGLLPRTWMTEKYFCQAAAVLAAGCLLALAVQIIQEGQLDNRTVTALERPEYGAGSTSWEMEYTWENGEGLRQQEKMMVQVEEQKYSPEEKERLLDEAVKMVEQEYLGENSSAGKVEYPLNLMEQAGNIPAEVSWSSSHPQYVDWRGALGEQIPPGGAQVQLQASLKLQGAARIFETTVTVYPEKLEEDESMERQVRQTLAMENEKEGEQLMLPAVVDGKTVTWRTPEEEPAKILLVLTAVSSLLFLWRGRQEEEKRQQVRKEQLLRDYPELLGKLTLLLGAGISMRRAMERIAGDYERLKEKKQTEIRYAYEEVRNTCREMEQGIPEQAAYERFGERCGLLPYRTFASLLVQNLQKGNQGMQKLLREEADRAQQQRRDRAKVLGEQASTRLLIPMILMLLVVFVILLVPAWLSFV